MNPRLWSPDDEAKLQMMVAQHMAWRIIGAHLGRSGQAVFNKAKAMGLGPKPFTGDLSVAWAVIVRVCSDGRARNAHELMAATGNGRATIDALMKKRIGQGRAHVARWDPRPGCPVPYWLPVPGRNAQKPKAKTSLERERARIERMKRDDPLRYDAYLAKKRVRTQLSRRGAAVQQHDVVRALFSGAQP